MEFKIASCAAEREAAFRLVHSRYLQSNLDAENPYDLRITPHHLLDSTTIFVGINDGEVVSTISLVEDSELGLPMEAMYEAEISQRRRSGHRLAEVTCLADRRNDLKRFLKVFLSLTRLLAQFARKQDIDELVATVHPRHAPFYMRYVGFEKFAGLSRCPYAGHNPSLGLSLSFAKCDEMKPRWYEEIFGRKIPERLLQPQKMSPQERNLLECVCDDIAGKWTCAQA